MVEDGDVLAALIIPPDITQKLEAGLEPASIEVLYNAEDPAKQAFVESTIESEVADANAAPTSVRRGGAGLHRRTDRRRVHPRAGDGRGARARRDAANTRAREEGAPDRLGRSYPDRPTHRLHQLAQQNVGLSDDVLASVGQPIRVDTTVVEGGTTPLSTFAVAIAVSVSLMFVTILRGGYMRAGARGERVPPPRGEGPRDPHRAARGEGRPAAVCANRAAGHAGRPGPVRRPRLEPLSAVACCARRRRGGIRRHGVALGALARSPRGIVARVHAVAPGGVPRLGAIGRGVERPVRCDPGDLRAIPVRQRSQRRRGAERRGDRGAALHLAALTLAFGVLGRAALRRFA